MTAKRTDRAGVASNISGQAPFLIISFLTSLAVSIIYVVVCNINNNPSAKFYDLISGSAAKPYVYRTLVPSIIHGIAAAIPPDIKEFIDLHLSTIQPITELTKLYKESPTHTTEVIVSFIILQLSLFLFMLVFQKMIGQLYTISHQSQMMLVLSGSILLLIFSGFGYIYDYTTLLLFNATALAMYRRQVIAYLLLFTMSCINKETTILLVFIFALYFRETPRGKYLILILAQLAIFTLVKITLSVMFAQNPGGNIEIYTQQHIISFTKLPFISVPFLIIQLIIPILLFWHPYPKPKLLLSTAYLYMPLLALYYLFGFPFEIRVFYEIYPAIFLLLCQTLAPLIQKTLQPQPLALQWPAQL